jgi:hypothetical protein
MNGRTTRWGKTAPLFVVDEEFAERVFRHSWVANCDGRYLVAQIGRKMQYLHRFVYELAHGRAPKIVDHVNRNRYDCRISNLREADWALSNRNRTHRRGTLPPGVGHKRAAKTNPYQAMVRRRGRAVHVGYFPSPESASLAVANAKLEVLVDSHPEREPHV